MRRKSERTAATKKTKASPEKKMEKVKRTRSRRKKQSSSSENESADEASPAPVEVPVEPEEAKPPKTPVKEESPEEAQDQVWKVKTAESSGNVGEIQKLKICLTRPPSTPERAERSPRSKRKHSRATSSSDTTSVEAPEEKEKRKSRRSKRSHRGSKDEADKNLDSQEEEMETENASQDDTEVSTPSKQSHKHETSENTITTSNQSHESVQSSEETSTDQVFSAKAKEDKVSDADTTVVSPKVSDTPVVTTASVPEPESSTQTDTQESKTESKESQKDTQNKTQESQKDNKESQNEQKDSNEKEKVTEEKKESSPERRRSMSVDKSEILELHPEENKCDSDVEMEKSKADDTEKATAASQEDKVSKVTEEKASNKELKKDYRKDTNVTGVVESSYKEKSERIESTDSLNNIEARKSVEESKLQCSDSTQSNQEEPKQNGQAAPIVVSRKRRWGSRPAKITTQKSITISTDILKDIIPDVKPVEFDEVIEERKPKREVTEKIERPILPKIIIDNTENIDRNIEHKRERDDKERDMVKPRDSHLAANRKISIVKDNDSIITRPPSPPRYKQSCVLYITNLVRPFTLPQLKNLLQRTGRIVENGFWIDKIKSRCFVIYETEDQAVETRHALHGVTWPVSNPKTLQVDFSTPEAFEKTKTLDETEGAPVSTIPGTVEDWLREQDQKRARGEELEKPWERRLTREWDLGKNENEKEKEKRFENKDQRPLEKRRNRTPERIAEPARKFKKKEEEAPAKLLDDLFKKTKTTPCIYWLPLSAETIAIKEEQRRQHMAEHERRMQEAQQRRALRDRERDRRH